MILPVGAKSYLLATFYSLLGKQSTSQLTSFILLEWLIRHNSTLTSLKMFPFTMWFLLEALCRPRDPVQKQHLPCTGLWTLKPMQVEVRTTIQMIQRRRGLAMGDGLQQTLEINKCINFGTVSRCLTCFVVPS